MSYKQEGTISTLSGKQHLTSYPSKTNKGVWIHKQRYLMDYYRRTHWCWLFSKYLHISFLCGQRIQCRRLAMSNGRLPWMLKEIEKETELRAINTWWWLQNAFKISIWDTSLVPGFERRSLVHMRNRYLFRWRECPPFPAHSLDFRDIFRVSNHNLNRWTHAFPMSTSAKGNTAPSRIWTRVDHSISYGDNCYTKCVSPTVVTTLPKMFSRPLASIEKGRAQKKKAIKITNDLYICDTYQIFFKASASEYALFKDCPSALLNHIFSPFHSFRHLLLKGKPKKKKKREKTTFRDT